MTSRTTPVETDMLVGRIEKFMVRSQKHRVRFENGETEDVDFAEEKVKVRFIVGCCVCLHVSAVLFFVADVFNAFAFFSTVASTSEVCAPGPNQEEKIEN